MRRIFVPIIAMLLSALSACQPAAERQTTSEFDQVTRLDMRQLPNQQWQLSHAAIEISFCRDRINEALLAEPGELNRWRLLGEPSAFPPYRQEGLEKLAQLYQQQQLLLWQVAGTVSAQRYHLVAPASWSKGAVADAVYPAVASLGQRDDICHIKVED
ncbi:hypothetical protein CWI84_08960 [Idiomarina tyrosinivorans]|uniref:SPOR domain-containing protein n=1 Tax=Idiomarina tyrosinivorans TaxID=1445662 RepID=A0A432ZPE3_9GAMM|nr:hypothetical protein [Idiomarina tyrosinivorans]RUO79753.1 hypothetical protein CWI84_08960 [Idiomarina tyrosinivorans]